MNRTIHPEAKIEYQDAFAYFENEQAGLGDVFSEQIEAALRNICAFPFACVELEPGIRRHVVRKFKYGIIYSVDKEGISILSFAHFRRKPVYWKQRLNQITQ